MLDNLANFVLCFTNNYTDMKFHKNLLLMVIAMVICISCGHDDEFDQAYKPTVFSVSGKAEKGPFISGSSITIQPLDEKLQLLGSMLSSTIQDDFGNFSFGSKLFEAPFAELTVNGYFFNEVEGQLSNGTLNLLALVDLSDKTSVNVNLLTHLKYYRVKKLVEDGANFKNANEQAQKELFSAFGLQKYANKEVSTFSITEGTNEAAALIAISSLMLINRSEADLTEYLAKISKEFGETGHFSTKTLEQINKDREHLLHELSTIRENIFDRYKKLGLEINVKELYSFIDWDGDGIAGNEILKEGQEIRLSVNSLEVPKEGGQYSIKIAAPVNVYLEESQISQDSSLISVVTPTPNLEDLYEHSENSDKKIEKYLKNDILQINVLPTTNRNSETHVVKLYDYVGNTVAKIKIIQKGDKNAALPKLGSVGRSAVKGFYSYLSTTFSHLNVIEQYYHFNKICHTADNIDAGNTLIRMAWASSYIAIHSINNMKDMDSKGLKIYQDYLNVFSAMAYYYMTTLWGDIPYIDERVQNYPKQTNSNVILEKLKKNLLNAISSLEEKKNITLTDDVNDIFFVSKDVARILLAKIHMSLNEYDLAEPLLSKVISNGFYNLDDSNYSKPIFDDVDIEIDTELGMMKSNKIQGGDIIFATKTTPITRTRSEEDIVIACPSVVPFMTYTDVILSYAECLFKNNKISDAEAQINKVLKAKNINVKGHGVMEKIKNIRMCLTLYTSTNFSFMKRANFIMEVYGIENFRKLLPIPNDEVELNPNITQNPGY